MKKAKGVGFILLAIVFLLVTGLIVYEEFTTLWAIPPDRKFEIKVAANSEIHPHSVVHPGTFTISLPLDEILIRAKTSNHRLLIAWSKDFVEYWLPTKDGYYYQALERVSELKRFTFAVKSAESQGKSLILHYERAAGSILFPAFVTILSIICTLILVNKGYNCFNK